jgi:hypothetical protein
MPTGSRSAIYVHIGALASREQQQRYAQEYCDNVGYTPTTLVFHPDDALKLVRDGLVDVIVCAYLPYDRQDLADLVEKAGGRLEAARAGSRVEQEVGKLIARLFRRGMTVAEIADVTDRDTQEIRRELHRHGLDE